MSPMDQAKARRDSALQSWRHELQLLKLCEPGSAAWERQKLAVEKAQAEYSKAADEYTEMLVNPDRPDRGAA